AADGDPADDDSPGRSVDAQPVLRNGLDVSFRDRCRLVRGNRGTRSVGPPHVRLFLRKRSKLPVPSSPPADHRRPAKLPGSREAPLRPDYRRPSSTDSKLGYGDPLFARVLQVGPLTPRATRSLDGVDAVRPDDR